jgi:hypothetical protein
MSEGSPDDWWVNWVRTRDIATVVERIRAIREGTLSDEDPAASARADPAGAMRLLGTFARHRATEHLLALWSEMEDAGGFAPLDATAVLTLAAMTRPVEEAATLAIEQWKTESGQDGTPLTDSIVHDVTAQRIVAEVAVFIAECRRREQADLVGKSLNAFAMTSSGRTDFDKALLYITLRAAGCSDEADELLRLTLLQVSAEASAQPVAGSADRVGLVAAMHHLSPSETIVEDWIERQMEVAQEEPTILALAASLLMGERDGDRELARHVGGTWEANRLIDLCVNLARRAQRRPGRLAVLGLSAQDSDYLARRAQERLTLVRGYAAARPDKDLVEVIRLWHKSGELTGTLKYLLADIVAGGPDSPAPRPIDFLDSLQQRLKRRRVPGPGRNELHIAAALQVSGRETGAEVAKLLGRVGRREQRRVAREVNRQLTAPLLNSENYIGREAAVERFVDYVDGLQSLPKAGALTFLALRALSDPGAGDHAPTGWVVADIAARVYAGVSANTGFDLLERCLENEQGLTDEDAADIVARVGLGAMHDDKHWYPLLSATVGRWADTSRRDGVVAALRHLHYGKEDADAIIRSVQ